MKIKECYVSHNGISCFTDINSLVNIKEIDFNKKIVNTFSKKNLISYILLRCIEEITKDIIENINNINNIDNIDNINNINNINNIDNVTSDSIINSIIFT